MQYVRRSSDRGHANFGWLDSHHTFSFGRYYDPKHMGFSVLRVINDDVVQPARGFDTHGHRDMEIISYVTKGALAHRDSTGNEGIIPAGEVQRMSAGSGITHSEYNASATEPVQFLQIWIEPAKRGVAPSYEQKAIVQSGAVTPLVTPDGQDGTLTINQNASMARVQLKAGEQLTLPIERKHGYLHVISGSVSSEDLTLNAGDGVGVWDVDALAISAQQDVEALWFDLV